MSRLPGQEGDKVNIITEEEFKELERETRVIKIKSGGMWEEKKWEIRLNCWVYEGGKVKCEHCVDDITERIFRSDGCYFDTIYTKCPRVVVAINEGGCNSTGVCLDCILEAEKGIKEESKQ